MDTDSKTAFICIQMKSHIWKIGVFKRINDTEAECRLCKENGESKYVLKISAGSVKGLITHLRSNIHKDSENAKEYERLVNNDQSTSGAVQIDKFFNQNSSGNLSQLDKKVINLIVCDNLPFLIINSCFFRSLVSQNIEKLKDESHYRKIVPEVYKAVKHKIKLEIKECTLSFTTDIWSNKSHGFISLTAQGISKKWSFKNFTLAIREFSTSHTASNIENKLDEILKEWNIERDYIHAFVTDSASNMVKAFEKLSEVYCCVRFSCAAHLLNRAVQQSFGAKEGAISQLFASCRRVVSHVKYSIKAMNELRIIQIEEGIQQHQLLQAMSVRWNSTLIMIERLLEQRLAIDRMAFEKRDFEKITLSVGEWNLLEPLKQLLKPVEELSLLLCKSRISVIIPYAKAIVSTISKLDLRVDTENGRREIIEIEDMRRKLVEEISNRFFCLQEIRAHSISTFLDPRFKAEFFDDKQISIYRIISWLKAEQKINDTPEREIEDFFDQVNEPPPSKRTFYDTVSELVKNTHTEPESNDEIEDEVKKYISQGCIEQNADPIEWWSKNEGIFKNLSLFAKKYLTAPATSIDSERLFSTARDLYDYRRYNISPMNGEMLLFLNKAIPIIKKY